jgi:hypothetical protein
MKDAHIKKYLEHLGSKPAPVDRDGWVVAKCPLAPWRHDSGVDKNPSFAVKIESKGDGFTHCFSCGWHGSQSDLVFEMRFRDKKDPSGDSYEFAEALQLIADAEEDAVVDLDFPDVEEELFGDKAGPHVFPEWWLESFSHAWGVTEARSYLQGRNVSQETAEALDLRWDSTQRRVCFPVRDFQGRLRGLHGRAVDAANPLKYRMYTYQKQNNPLVWLGEHWIDFDRPVVVVESVFDLAAVHPLYPNVTSPLTAGLSLEKIQRMGDVMEQVTLFDGDKAGQRARKKYRESLADCLIAHAELPEGVKDPGEATVSQLVEALAPFVPVEGFQLD